MGVMRSAGRRISGFVTGPVNAAGSALGIGGVLLHVGGVVGGPMWWLVVVGLYGTGAVIGTWAESLRSRHVQEVAQDGLDVDAIQQALTNQFRAINGRVPAVVMMRFLQIRKTINELLPRARELPPGSMELFTLQQTALDYLPGALQTYLRLPPAYATAHAVDGSRTPLQVLTDELTLLATNVDKVAETVRRQDTDRLLVHDRFLEDRFGDGLSAVPSPTHNGEEAAADSHPLPIPPRKAEGEKLGEGES